MCKYLNINDIFNQQYNFSIAVLGLIKLANSLNLKVLYSTYLQSYAGRTSFNKKSYNYFNSLSSLLS